MKKSQFVRSGKHQKSNFCNLTFFQRVPCYLTKRFRGDMLNVKEKQKGSVLVAEAQLYKIKILYN